MARIYPFRAFRYDPARVHLEDVVTQPYDKITPAMQERYYEASPYNLVRVILGKQLPGDDEQENVYTRAAETLRDWRREGILKEESEPALYGYSQTYTVPHTTEVRERRGLIALGRLYDYADKVVYRHEQTFPQHKSDRMSLFKATRAYCEQVYMLYSDPAFTVEKLIFGVREANGNGSDCNPADLSITDEYGVVHRIWKLTDPTLINLVVTAMADKKLIIADGHHRYETSVAYSKERSSQLKLPLNQPRDEEERLSPGNLPEPPFPEAAMMMTFVNMEAPGITILPTHRVVHGIEGFSSPDFIAVPVLTSTSESWTHPTSPSCPRPSKQPSSPSPLTEATCSRRSPRPSHPSSRTFRTARASSTLCSSIASSSRSFSASTKRPLHASAASATSARPTRQPKWSPKETPISPSSSGPSRSNNSRRSPSPGTSCRRSPPTSTPSCSAG